MSPEGVGVAHDQRFKQTGIASPSRHTSGRQALHIMGSGIYQIEVGSQMSERL